MRSTAALLASLLIVSACGSTVTDAGTPAPVPVGTDGTALNDGMGLAPTGSGRQDPEGGPEGGPSSTAVVPSTGTSSGADAPQGDAPAAPPSSQPPPGSQPPPPAVEEGPTAAPVGPGITDTTIYVGATYDPQQGESNAALGAAGTDPGDQRQYYDAFIDEINAAGGIGGRNLEPVYFELNDSYATTQQAEQAACVHWTEDNQVFAMLGVGSSLMRECGRDARALVIKEGFSTATTETFQEYPTYFEVSTVNLDRIGRITVKGLHNDGYFADQPTIGLITWDSANYRYAIDHGYSRALANIGLEAAVTRYASVPESESDLGSTSVDVNNAVLAFREQGVDHVMILDGPAGNAQGTVLTLLFLKAASSQGYYPKYGMNQTNSPMSGLRAGLWTREELHGSHAVVWLAADDSDDEGLTPNPVRHHCFDVLEERGIVTDNPNAVSYALQACSLLYFLRAGMGPGGDALTDVAVRDQVDRLGTSFRSPTAYANRFGPNQHDGAGAARNAVYVDDCHCFRYTTGAYALD